MSLLNDFKAFLMKGNVIDLAVGMVVGTAFTGMVKSLVDDVIMPPIGLLLGNVDFSNLFIVLKDGAEIAPPYASVAAAQAAGGDQARLRMIGKGAGGNVLLHIPQAILRRVVGHVPARAVLLGGVRRDDVGEGLQVDALVPNPAEQCEKQHQ